MKYTEIEGDLIALAKQGEFKVITHGCNCFCTMEAGTALQMAEAFGCDKFPLESYRDKADINKLGQIDWKIKMINPLEGTVQGIIEGIENRSTHIDQPLIVVNSYTQFGFGADYNSGTSSPLDYEALQLCFRKINHTFKGNTIGLPLIGCGLALGHWSIVKKLIHAELADMDVTVVHYKP